MPRFKFLAVLSLFQGVLAWGFWSLFQNVFREYKLGHEELIGGVGFVAGSLTLSLVSAAAAIGVWRSRLWGQWLAIASLGISAAYMFRDWQYRRWNLIYLLPLLLLLLGHLLPTTWRAFRPAKLETTAPSS